MNRTLLPRLAAGPTAALVLALAACSGADTSADVAAPEAATTVEVTDNFGTQTVPSPPQRVVALDNRTFETLESWDVELVAGARTLMSPELSYREDESIVDTGNHREPDLEALVGVDPDLVVNGQRYSSYREDIAALVPDAAIVELDPVEGEPFDAELRRQTEVLGQVFAHEAEAAATIAEFDAAIERVQAAYDPEQSVMAVLTSGGEISYVAPTDGRTLGPLFDIFAMTPALEVEGDANSHGDDISVEAIAQADPDWILVMDRDAGTAANSEEPFTPANELIASSEALQNVSAVQSEQIVYAPTDTYLNEGIQTYTEYFNTLADAMESSA